jgi:mannose-6-phosphate isomerase-like protein (cupin superfamily)
MNISSDEALAALQKSGKVFIELFQHGTLSVEMYKPDKVDHQSPHARDEVYVVVSGTGNFYCNGEVSTFAPGTFLFVPAGIEHRFLDFTDDFKTWVLFYGPAGGEIKT